MCGLPSRVSAVGGDEFVSFDENCETSRMKFTLSKISTLRLLRNSAIVFALTLVCLLPAMSVDAQDLSGKWSVQFNENAVLVKDQSWTLLQTTVLGTPVISGYGTDADGSFTLEGTHSGTRVTFTEQRIGSTYSLVLEGPLASEDSFACTWSDSDIHSGDCGGVKTSRDIGPVTPGTTLQDPPAVIVRSNSAILLFRRFSGAAKKDLPPLAAMTRALSSKARLGFRYAVEVTRTADGSGNAVKKNVLRKTSKKNTLTLSKLSPGQYSVRYRVEITKQVNNSDSVAGRTKFSPAASFAIAG